jgi:hypothetical protein
VCVALAGCFENPGDATGPKPVQSSIVVFGRVTNPTDQPLGGLRVTVAAHIAQCNLAVLTITNLTTTPLGEYRGELSAFVPPTPLCIEVNFSGDGCVYAGQTKTAVGLDFQDPAQGRDSVRIDAKLAPSQCVGTPR